MEGDLYHLHISIGCTKGAIKTFTPGSIELVDESDTIEIPYNSIPMIYTKDTWENTKQRMRQHLENFIDAIEKDGFV